MLFNNLPLPLTWHNNLLLQDRFRQNVAVNAVHAQLAPYNGLLPFQIIHPTTSELPYSWKIKCATDATVANIIAGYTEPTILDISGFAISALTAETLDGNDILTFKNANNSLAILAGLAGGLVPGVYYMEMIFTSVNAGVPIVSELFRVPVDRFQWNVPSTCNYPVLKWYHNSDFKPIHYPGDASFYNLLYLDSFVTASEPELEITGEKDGNDELFPTFQKAVIKYRLSAVVPDFIKIALFIMQMHDNKFLTLEYGLRTGEIKNIDVSASLTNDGAYSVVEILFEQMQLITDTSCDDEMVEPSPYSISDGQTLVTTYCEAGGAVTAEITAIFATGVYGELWGKIAGVYTKVYNYISRADLLAGWTGNIGAGLGVTEFKVRYRTFVFYTGESALSTPTPSC